MRNFSAEIMRRYEDEAVRHNVELKDFARRGFEALGSVVEETDGRLDVLLDETQSRHFQNREILQLRMVCGNLPVLTPSVIAGEDLFAPGFPAFEGLLERLACQGFLAKAYLNPFHLGTGDLAEKFSKRISIEGARPFLKLQNPEMTASAVFHFKVSFLTDDRTDRLYPAAVNLTSGLSEERLLEQWDRLFWEPESGYSGLMPFKVPDLGRFYARALEEVKKKAAPKLQEIRGLQEKFLKRELARMEEYYSDLWAELDRKEKKAGGDEALLEKIRLRRKALEMDSQKRIVDLRDKYRIEIRIRPVNLLILYQPGIRSLWGFKTHHGDFERIFYWDPVFKDFSDYACELCSVPSRTFCVHDQRLLCPSCRSKP